MLQPSGQKRWSASDTQRLVADLTPNGVMPDRVAPMEPSGGALCGPGRYLLKRNVLSVKTRLPGRHLRSEHHPAGNPREIIAFSEKALKSQGNNGDFFLNIEILGK